MENLEMASVSPQIGWGKVSGNHQDGAVCQVDGDSDTAPPPPLALWEVEGCLRKETMASASTLFLAESCP